MLLHSSDFLWERGHPFTSFEGRPARIIALGGARIVPITASLRNLYSCAHHTLHQIDIGYP
jgi:hypothetical protein